MRSNFSRIVSLGLYLCCSGAWATENVPIVTRQQWGAKPVIGEMQKHKPNAILVHHTGAPAKLKTDISKKMQGLQRFSQAKEKLADGRMKPAWPDLPYHFYIAADGTVAEGRDLMAVGDTNTGYDPTGFIQVVVEGNFEVAEPSKAQLSSLKMLLSDLKQKFSINAASIHGHQEKAQTACPGAELASRLPDIIKTLD